MNEEKPKRSLLCIFLIVCGIMLLALGSFFIYCVSSHLQYIIPINDNIEKENIYQKSIEAQKRLSTMDMESSLTARIWDVQISTDHGDAFVTIYAIDRYYMELYHETLVEGRFVTDGDIENEKNVIVIDQNTAFHLFPGKSAIGKTIRMGETDWTVVGLIRDSMRFGEVNESVAYIPLSSVNQYLDISTSYTFEINVCRDKAMPVAVAKTLLTEEIHNGTLIDLSVEKIKAIIPIIWICMVTICIYLKRTIGFLKKYVKKTHSAYICLLEKQYANRLLVWLLIRIFIFALGAFAVFCIVAWMVSAFQQLVFMFPNWVPEKPFSIPSYISRFWVMNNIESVAIQCTSHDKSIISLSSGIIRFGWTFIMTSFFITRIKNCSIRRKKNVGNND